MPSHVVDFTKNLILCRLGVDSYVKFLNKLTLAARRNKKNFWALLGKVGTFGHPGQFFTPPLRKHTEEWNTWKELKKKKKQFSPDV